MQCERRRALTRAPSQCEQELSVKLSPERIGWSQWYRAQPLTQSRGAMQLTGEASVQTSAYLL